MRGKKREHFLDKMKKEWGWVDEQIIMIYTHGILLLLLVGWQKNKQATTAATKQQHLFGDNNNDARIK